MVDNTNNHCSISVHTNCIGTQRMKKPIMITIYSEKTRVFEDYFLTKDEVEFLIKNLQKSLENAKE